MIYCHVWTEKAFIRATIWLSDLDKRHSIVKNKPTVSSERLRKQKEERSGGMLFGVAA